MAVSCDGSTLLVSDYSGGSHAIHELRVADGSPLRVIGKKSWIGMRGAGDGPLQFNGPRQVWVASDDFVFVADYANNRVQVLTPSLEFHAFVGVGRLDLPAGVCANADVVVVSESKTHRISVFRRADGRHLRRFGSFGSGSGQMHYPGGLCFMNGDHHVAVAEDGNNRVSVFSVKGKFIRHVGVGKLKNPRGVVCGAVDELAVADWGNGRITVFTASGELLKTMKHGAFAGVAIDGGTVFAQDWSDHKCVIFTCCL